MATSDAQDVMAPSDVSDSQSTRASDPPTSLVRHDHFVELPPGSVVGETYEIEAKIGVGGMGEVYAARHLRLGKRVAIKVIGRRLSEDAGAIERFAREARVLARLQHPAIVAVESVGELADGRAYFVMEYLHGEALFDRLECGPVPFPEALRIVDEIARALEAAHARGVIHRDLKPENVFLVHLPGEPAIVKIVDFGLAKLAADLTGDQDFGPDDDRANRTQSGIAIGTPMYCSPEQARGVGVDHRTDIYALGCIAFELVLGQPPFPQARTPPEFWAAHLHEQPPTPRSIWALIPPHLDRVLGEMLAKDPNDRPTLAGVRDAIARARENALAARAETLLVDRVPVTSPRRRVAAAVVATLLVGVTIGAVLAARSWRSVAREAIIARDAGIAAEHHASVTANAVPRPLVDAGIDAPPPSAPLKPSRRAPDLITVPVTAPKPPRRAPDPVTAPTPPRSPDPIVAPPPRLPSGDAYRDQTINPFAKRKNP